MHNGRSLAGIYFNLQPLGIKFKSINGLEFNAAHFLLRGLGRTLPSCVKIVETTFSAREVWLYMLKQKYFLPWVTDS